MRIKNFIDFCLSWGALILLSPIFWIIAGIIKIDSAGPAFFRQERIGKNGKPFISYKFRTMVDNAASKGLGLNIAVDDDRITAVGKILRNTSLDELPQLFNVVRGEMSIIGPRPTLRYQVVAYDAFQRRRLAMKPGITGWAQINGRNAIPWEERIKLDIWYVDNWSLKLDVQILGRTIGTVIRREGLYGPDGINYDFRPSRVPAT
ncbi:MAG TPA: sugar transferase [Desulfobacterales bacterium]|nr:sugar transferase [Desulfobacterales bacterium]